MRSATLARTIWTSGLDDERSRSVQAEHASSSCEHLLPSHSGSQAVDERCCWHVLPYYTSWMGGTRHIIRVRNVLAPPSLCVILLYPECWAFFNTRGIERQNVTGKHFLMP